MSLVGPAGEPASESARLAALHRYSVLDSAPEQAFDDLTNLASLICATPIALISLVDSRRIWFKSKVDLNATEIPRIDGFCSSAILSDPYAGRSRRHCQPAVSFASLGDL